MSYAASAHDAADRPTVTQVAGAVGGKATSATSTTLVDSLRTEADGAFSGYTVVITSGTGSGQQRRVSDYAASTHTLTVGTAWTTTPDNTSTYSLVPAAAVMGQATSATSTTLVDTARTETTTDYFKGYWLLITAGTGAGEARAGYGLQRLDQDPHRRRIMGDDA